jgi:hypothetical protein
MTFLTVLRLHTKINGNAERRLIFVFKIPKLLSNSSLLINNKSNLEVVCDLSNCINQELINYVSGRKENYYFLLQLTQV